MSVLPFATACEDSARDAHWMHCRNSLGIARLLVQEGRPRALVRTSCLMAVESACRAALDQGGLRFDGDLRRAMACLAAPRDLWSGAGADTPGAELLSEAERTVEWIAAYLRGEAPERSWGF